MRREPAPPVPAPMPPPLNRREFVRAAGPAAAGAAATIGTVVLDRQPKPPRDPVGKASVRTLAEPPDLPAQEKEDVLVRMQRELRLAMAKPAEERQWVMIIDHRKGKGWLGECLLGLDECSDPSTCPTHDFWQRIRQEIRAELTETILATVIAFKAQARTRPLPGQTPVKGSTASRRKSRP